MAMVVVTVVIIPVAIRTPAVSVFVPPPARATGRIPAPGAIAVVRLLPADFASHTVQSPGAPDGRLSRCAPGKLCHRREPPAHRGA
jgi:hypothetical protein